MPTNLPQGTTIDDYKVSRQEEAEALAYIKKHLVSEAVEYFEVNKASYGRKRDDIINANKVAQNLRKMEHHHAGETGRRVNEADYIVYEGYDSTEDYWPPTPFQFIITKEHDEYGWIFLEAGYKNPLRKGHTIVTMVKRTKRYRTPLKEGVTSKFEISNQEEKKALQFIRNNLLVGPLEKVRKHLKKTVDDKVSVFHFITFSAWVDGTWHGYRITKDPEGFWVLRLTNGSAEKDNKWLIKEGKGRLRRYIQQETIPLLSKREKDEAFHKLKLIVLPKAVNEMNNYLIGMKGKDAPKITVGDALKYLKKIRDDGTKVVYKAAIPELAEIVLFTEKKNTQFVISQFGRSMVYIGYLSAGTQFPHQFLMHNEKPSLEESRKNTEIKRVPPITKKEEAWAVALLKKHYVKEFPEIGKHLRKIKIHPTFFSEDRSDEIIYEYLHDKNRAIFSIIKTPAGLWLSMTPGWQENSRDCMNLDVLKQRITETFEDPNIGSQYLDKRDIHEAMDFIKKKIIPIVAQEYNKNKHIDDKTLTPQDITKELKVTFMRDATCGGTVFLHSVILNHDFKFIIAKRKRLVGNGDSPNSKVTKTAWRLAVSYILPPLIDSENSTVWYWVGQSRLQTRVPGLVFESERPPTLTKKQEHYALDIIKKKLLPTDLEEFNNNISNIKSWYKAQYPSLPTLQPLDLEQALKLLHKTYQSRRDNLVRYVIDGPNGYPSMYYEIDKNVNGSISIYYEELIQKRSRETVITL